MRNKVGAFREDSKNILLMHYFITKIMCIELHNIVVYKKTVVVGLNPCFSDPDTDRFLANRFQKIEKTMSGQRSYTICLTFIHICKSLFSIYEMRTEFRQHISENGKPGRFSQHGFNSTNTGISRFLPQREIYSYITTKIRSRFNMYLYMLHNS